MKNLLSGRVCNMLLSCILAACILSCKDKENSSIDPISDQSITDAGKPTGEPTSKTIGTEGGLTIP